MFVNHVQLYIVFIIYISWSIGNNEFVYQYILLLKIMCLTPNILSPMISKRMFCSNGFAQINKVNNIMHIYISLNKKTCSDDIG